MGPNKSEISPCTQAQSCAITNMQTKFIRLTQLREEHNFTKAELGRRAAVQGSIVGSMENGRHIPPAGSSTLKKLARVLGVPEDRADELMREVSR